MQTQQNVPIELKFHASKKRADPFNYVELDAIVTEPDGVERRVPGFWAGGDTWKLRLCGSTLGRHTWRTQCSDATDRGLHNQTGQFEVVSYERGNPLYKHGPLRVSANRRYLEHADGTPFFWLGDTWWLAMCNRLPYLDAFAELLDNRKQRGFSVIQIVAGLYPDQAFGDPRNASDSGFAWQGEFETINPAFFDEADQKLQAIIDASLCPCIFGCWGYYLPMMGPRKMRQHWRYLVARYGAWPVTFCLAGEGEMPWYLCDDLERDRQLLRRGWTQIAAYVRSINGYQRLITMHPTTAGRKQIEDPALLDFDMLQTGHNGYPALENNVRRITEGRAAEPTMPVVVGELNYEGIMATSGPDMQHHAVWASLLSGAAGFTYGANGIWQFNELGQPPYISPGGATWGGAPWREAMPWRGAAEVGMTREVLAPFDWSKFEPINDWFTPAGTFTAGIPDKVRVTYIPATAFWSKPWTLRRLPPQSKWRVFLVNPSYGAEVELDPIVADRASVVVTGPSREHVAPIIRDWLLIAEAADGSARA